MTTETVSYGIGGYDPGHPSGNVIERLVDNGDGTGTHTTYDAAGQVTATEALTGLPIPAPPVADPAERIAALEATVDALLAIIEGA